MMDILWSAIAILLGLIIGSFLNCVIYRLQKKETLGGRSYCPNCQHQLSWYDLVPLFSFFWLKGACRYCGKKISWQYPLVELTTALLFLFIVNLGLSIAATIFLWYIASSLIVIFVYDWKHYLIPDSILFPAVIITLIYQLASGHDMVNYVLAALLASGFFLAIFLVSRGRWMGFGDVKFAVLMGLLLGFPNILAALFMAFFIGAVVGVIAMLANKKGLKSEMPFAPFLILGTAIAIFWGPQIISWYMRVLL